jgi:hypothetical protein
MLHGKVETRTWYTKVRGPILICCSQKGYSDKVIESISGPIHMGRMKNILNTYGLGWGTKDGFAIGIGTLVDCYRMEQRHEVTSYVKYHPDLFCHFYEDVIPLPTPFRVKGQMGFFNVDDKVAGFNLLDWYEKKLNLML